MNVDVFNGDADGLCSLQQLRLAQPLEATLVTGVKRDVELLARVDAGAGDAVTVLDVSMHTNRAHLQRLLDAGARVDYYDHHHAGTPPAHPALRAFVDTAPDVCTALIVDRELGGRHRAWAIAAAYGDGLTEVAGRLAAAHGYDAAQQAALRRLGELLNYNGYGDTLADLHFDPAALHVAMRGFGDPLAFAASAPEVGVLAAGLAHDLAWAAGVEASRERRGWRLFELPDRAEARRVSGTLANRLARERPGQAHALLTPNTRGRYTVSVRAPLDRPRDALRVAQAFGGSGREGAAGINDLPAADVDRLADELERVYGRGGR